MWGSHRCKTGKHSSEKPQTKAAPSPNNRPMQINTKTGDAALDAAKAACGRCRQGFFCSEHSEYFYIFWLILVSVPCNLCAGKVLIWLHILLDFDLDLIELSFISTRVWVRSWLFCIQDFSWKVSFWCMVGVGVGVWMKNFLSWLIEEPKSFWHAKMSLALSEPIQEVVCSNLHTEINDAPKIYISWKVL